MLLVLLGMYLELELLGIMVIIFLEFSEILTWFPKRMNYFIFISYQQYMRVPVSPHSHQPCMKCFPFVF